MKGGAALFKRICGLALLAFGLVLLMGLMVEKTDAGTAETPVFPPPVHTAAMRPSSQSPDTDSSFRVERQGAPDDDGMKAFVEKSPARVRVLSDSNGRTLASLSYYRAAYTAFRLTDSAG